MIYQASYFNATGRLMKEVTFDAATFTEAIEIILEQTQLKPPNGAEMLQLRILTPPAAA